MTTNLTGFSDVFSPFSSNPSVAFLERPQLPTPLNRARKVGRTLPKAAVEAVFSRGGCEFPCLKNDAKGPTSAGLSIEFPILKTHILIGVYPFVSLNQ